MSFKRSTLFMIRKKCLDMDLSDIDLTKMEGHDVSNLVDGSAPLEDQGAKKTLLEDAMAD